MQKWESPNMRVNSIYSTLFHWRQFIQYHSIVSCWINSVSFVGETIDHWRLLQWAHSNSPYRCQSTKPGYLLRGSICLFHFNHDVNRWESKQTTVVLWSTVASQSFDCFHWWIRNFKTKIFNISIFVRKNMEIDRRIGENKETSKC